MKFRPRLEAVEDRAVPASIAGTAYLDANANNVFDPGEGGLAGATVTLYLSPGWATTGTTTTAADGTWAVGGQAAGSYYAWVSHAPSGTGRMVGVTVPSASSAVTGVDAGFNLGGTTTSVATSAGSVGYGSAVTFTATVSASSTPSGSVTFYDGATAIGTGTLNASGVATLTTSALAIGSHSITASYTGSSSHAGSTSSPVTETVSARVVYWVAAAAGNWSTPGNWSTGSVPGANDAAYFNGSHSNAGATTLGQEVGFASPAEIRLLGGYTGTVTLTTPVSVRTLELTSGTIDQAASAYGSDLTVTAAMLWTGGTLNSTTNAATVTISGATALIAPAGAGTLSIGSTLSFDNGAFGTVMAGTVSFTNDVSYVLSGASTLISDTSAGNVVFQQPAGGLAVSGINAGTTRTISGGGTDTEGATLAVTGTLRIIGGTRMNATGGSPTVVSVGTDKTAGAGVISIENGSTLQVANGLGVGPGGKLNTTSKTGGGADQRSTPATIQGDFYLLGGDVTLDAGNPNPHVWSLLKVTGNVTWNGGTLHLAVDAVATTTKIDQWVIDGSLSVTVTLVPFTNVPMPGSPAVAVSAVNGLPATGQVWRKLVEAKTGITTVGPLPDAGAFTLSPQPGTPIKIWDLQY